MIDDKKNSLDWIASPWTWLAVSVVGVAGTIAFYFVLIAGGTKLVKWIWNG